MKQSLPLPSERKFGLLFATVCAFFGFYGVYKFWPAAAITVLFFAAAVFLVLAFAAPKVLAPLNRGWFALGLMLGKIVSPIVLGMIFFLLITPTALVTRIFGRDELRLKKRKLDSYWLQRDPVGPDAKSFNNQF